MSKMIDFDLLPYGFRSLLSDFDKLRDQLKQAQEDLVTARQGLGVLKPYRYVKFGNLDPKQPPEIYEQLHTEALAAAEENVQIAEKNAIILRNMTAVIKDTGFASSHMTWVRNKRKTIEHDWLVNLCFAMPVNELGTKGDIERRWEDYQRARRDYLTAEAKRVQEAEDVRQRETRKLERVRITTKWAIRFGLSSETGYDELIDWLLGRDKWLRLSEAMRQTREDWSDGFYRVRNALQAWPIENDTDRAIYEELNDLVFSDETDGRVFRDCTWNYARLTEFIEDSIAEAYSELIEYRDTVTRDW